MFDPVFSQGIHPKTPIQQHMKIARKRFSFVELHKQLLYRNYCKGEVFANPNSVNQNQNKMKKQNEKTKLLVGVCS